ncbi:MAG: type II toxin-antitoxin system RelE/ParE family toxin [Moorea sp. SIO2B7]|nr:type II toxin-antitoxin system RelE/ParE family toxin [Moorena sp. SIO2B7]
MIEYSIEFFPSARKQLIKLPQEIQHRIGAKIEELKTDAYPPGVKTLKNGGGRLRLRVGDYRIIYRGEANRIVIVIIKVGHRRNIYR